MRNIYSLNQLNPGFLGILLHHATFQSYIEKHRLLLSGVSDMYEWVNYYIKKSLGASTHVEVELRFFQHQSPLRLGCLKRLKPSLSQAPKFLSFLHF